MWNSLPMHVINSSSVNSFKNSLDKFWIGNANPEGIFQTRVYGFDGLQTRVPGFDYVSPAGGR